MRMKTATRQVGDSYFDLVRRFPLARIRSVRHYDDAVAFMNLLAIRGEDELDSGERVYLDALAQFVSDYEREKYRIDTADLSPLEALRYLMDSNGMKPADLGRIVGTRSLASQILLGKRDLSKAHIIKLAERFHVEPGLFMRQA